MEERTMRVNFILVFILSLILSSIALPAELNSIKEVLKNRWDYDQQVVTVKGIVRMYDREPIHRHDGFVVELYDKEDMLNIFSFRFPKISHGDSLVVTGRFFAEGTADRSSLRNYIDVTRGSVKIIQE
jgi:hypothetical protein